MTDEKQPSPDMPSAAQLSRLADFVRNQDLPPVNSDADLQLATDAAMRSPLSTLMSSTQLANATSSVADLLTEEPIRSDLVAFKQYAKQQTTEDQPVWPDKVARLLYYASVAQGLRWFQDPLGNLSPEQIEKGLKWCLGLPWLDKRLKAVVEAAQAD